MNFKQLFWVLLVIMACISGCIFDEDDEKDEVTSIDQLTVGGGVFIVSDQGYAFSQIGVFYGSSPYEDAEVFINGVQLTGIGGIYSEVEPLSIENMNSGESLRISVYARGDSLVNELIIPDDPVIVEPEEGTVATVGDSMYVKIGFPGDHRYIAMTMTGQEGVAVGLETSDTYMVIPISGEKLSNTGTSLLSAYSINTSGDIPESFDVQNQYEIFLVASIALRQIEFVEP